MMTKQQRLNRERFAEFVTIFYLKQTIMDNRPFLKSALIWPTGVAEEMRECEARSNPWYHDYF
ncbi:MAG: hypothetical protein LUF27_13760 [Lachnospiraceae bacterium]|nr:hypothetical protein [Lachnospiraceae bacterium]